LKSVVQVARLKKQIEGNKRKLVTARPLKIDEIS